LISFQAAARVDPTVWLLIVYIGIFATATPYLLNAWALARVNPSTVAIFVYLQPLIGFIMAVVFLGETIGPAFGIASLLVFAGVYLTARRGTLSGKRYRRDVVGSRIETKREPEA
jgi:drug/metabolite transporter (DMT)-like permease